MNILYFRVEYKGDDPDRLIDAVLKALAEEDATLYVEGRTDDEPSPVP